MSAEGSWVILSRSRSPLSRERAELAYLAPASSPSVSRCHSMPKSRATLMRGA
ncbi:hypothetical protein D3C84_1116600 [compost metagenome]